jgi:thioredoxin-related protein
MKRLAAVLLLTAVAWAQPALAAEPSPHAIDIPKWFVESFLDLRDDVRDAQARGKRLMVYFGQDGCPYCKALMKVTFGDEAVAAATRRDFMAVALNLWGDREVTWIDGRTTSEKELGRRLDVQFTPTLLFFDEKGAVRLRLNGYQPPERFRLALEYARKGGDTSPSFTAFLAKRAGGSASPEPDIAALVRKGKPVVVVVSSPNCRECDELEREAFQRPDVKRLLDAFTVERQSLAGAWAYTQGVSFPPSLVFLDRAGREVFRSDGYLRPYHVAAMLEYVSSGAYAKEKSFQRYIQRRADEARARGGTVDLWK